LGFEWAVCVVNWEDRLSELADYHKIHGHCNVPRNYSENSKLANWVNTQRMQYRLHLKGMTSSITLSRIQELESLDFKWGCVASWECRLSELADYHKIHGHCNVSRSYSENSKLAIWVNTQRNQYKLHLEGKASSITLSRIQGLESMGFKWGCVASWECRLNELADYHKIHGHCNVPQRYSENSQLAYWVNRQRKQYKLHLEGKTSSITLSRIQELESIGFEWKPNLGLRQQGKPNLDDVVIKLASGSTKATSWRQEEASAAIDKIRERPGRKI
jgi:hypothetical protein